MRNHSVEYYVALLNGDPKEADWLLLDQAEIDKSEDNLLVHVYDQGSKCLIV